MEMLGFFIFSEHKRRHVVVRVVGATAPGRSRRIQPYRYATLYYTLFDAEQVRPSLEGTYTIHFTY